MAEHNDEPISPGSPSQDWGRIVGVGAIILAVLVMVINLFAHKDPILFARPYKEVTIPSAWVQIGRFVGLLVSLGGGGWLLRHLLRQRQAPGRTSFETSGVSGGIAQRAHLLFVEVKDAVEKCPIPSTKKALLIKQAGEIPDNVVRVIWKLEQLGRIGKLAQSEGEIQKEMKDLEAKLQAAAEDSVQLLASVPLSLIRLELAHRDTGIEEILASLRESNRRMRDLAEAYDEVRGHSPG